MNTTSEHEASSMTTNEQQRFETGNNDSCDRERARRVPIAGDVGERVGEAANERETVGMGFEPMRPFGHLLSRQAH